MTISRYLCLLALLPVPAAAFSLGPVSVGGDATLMSDYRFRGVSLSGRDPVATGSLNLDGPAGLFAGVIGTSGSDYRGGDGEIDAYGGLRHTLVPVDATVGVFHYAFPGARHADFTEVFASVARTLGPAEVTLGVNYAPRQANLDDDNVYGYAAASVGVPGTPLTVKASLGYDDGGVARNLGLTRGTVDYALGVEAKLGVVVLGARFVGNDAHGGGRVRDTVVASAGVRF